MRQGLGAGIGVRANAGAGIGAGIGVRANAGERAKEGGEGGYGGGKIRGRIGRGI